MKRNEELSENERTRYDRQMMIEGFGEEGQKKLGETTALIAGAGGLGSPISIYLTVAGVGKLRIVDNDEVELSNLNRQILYGDDDIGRGKAEIAKKLRDYNCDIEVETIGREITEGNISELADNCDIIVDCMDNYPTRYILNRESQREDIPLFHAAVEGMKGQVTTIIPGETPCLRCIVPNPPPPKKFPVLGASPGLLGCIQAHEVVKYLVGIGNLLTNQLLVVEGGTEYNKVRIRQNPDCKVCGEGSNSAKKTEIANK